MRRKLLSYGIFTLILRPILSRTFAQGDNDRTRASLRGISSVAVISSIIPEVEAKGLTQEGIQTDTKLKLRLASISIVDADAWAANPDSTIALFINVTFYRIEGTTLYAYAVNVELNQWVRSEREPSLRIMTPTWSTGSIGASGYSKLYAMREVIKNHVDEFLNAYLSVNPRK